MPVSHVSPTHLALGDLLLVGPAEEAVVGDVLGALARHGRLQRLQSLVVVPAQRRELLQPVSVRLAHPAGKGAVSPARSEVFASCTHISIPPPVGPFGGGAPHAAGERLSVECRQWQRWVVPFSEFFSWPLGNWTTLTLHPPKPS